METGLGLKSKQCAGVVFQPIATADFKQIVDETEELLAGTAEETGTKVATHDDEYGYRWLILRDDDPDDLVVAMNTVSVELQGARLRRPPARRGVRVRGRERQADLLHLQLQARRLLPLRARRPARRPATARKSSASRPSWPASCPGKRTWPAGSRSGTSRCRRFSLWSGGARPRTMRLRALSCRSRRCSPAAVSRHLLERSRSRPRTACRAPTRTPWRSRPRSPPWSRRPRPQPAPSLSRPWPCRPRCSAWATSFPPLRRPSRPGRPFFWASWRSFSVASRSSVVAPSS